MTERAVAALRRLTAPGAVRAVRLTAANLALAGIYWGVAQASLAGATEHRVVSSIWPPAGIAFFALVRFGTWLWPGVALGAFLLNVWSGIPVLGALVIAAGDTLEAAAGTWLVRWAVTLRWSLDRVRDVVAVTMLAGGLSTIIAATIGVTTLVVAGSASPSAALSLWLVWWTGDAVGVLVIAPLLLVWTSPESALPPLRWPGTAAALSFAALAILTDVLFARWGTFIFAVYPAGIWLAWRYGPRGAATAVATVTLIATVRTLSGYGPFAAMGPTAGLFGLQLFIALFAVKGLVFAAARVEAEEGHARLHVSEARYRMLAQHLPDGCVVLFDEGLRLLLVEGPAVVTAGFVKDEVEGRTLGEIFDAEHAQALGEPFREAIRGKLVEFSFAFRERTYLVRVLPLPREPKSPPRGMALALDVTARESAQREIAESREQLERLSRSLLTAQEDERRRVAREIHDELGQALTAVKLGLANALQRPRRPSLEAERHLRIAADTLDQAIDSVKRIILRLRPGVLDNLGPLAALEYEVQQFRQRTRLAVTLDLPPEPIAIDAAGSTTIYRTVQEALTNVLRHAEAQRVEVSLVAGERELILEVSDDGRGIDEEHLRNPRSVGILGMRERASACGGRLDLHRVPTGGTRVTLTIPRAAQGGSGA